MADRRLEITIAGQKHRFALGNVRVCLGEFDLTKTGYSFRPCVRTSLNGWNINGNKRTEYRGTLDIEVAALSKMMEALDRELRSSYYFMQENDLLDKFMDYKEEARAEAMKAQEQPTHLVRPSTE
jgi:hypothetical protein